MGEQCGVVTKHGIHGNKGRCCIRTVEYYIRIKVLAGIHRGGPIDLVFTVGQTRHAGIGQIRGVRHGIHHFNNNIYRLRGRNRTVVVRHAQQERIHVGQLAARIGGGC